ncbi:exosome catalytic subunit dis3 [Mucor velutinosus]|uniref:Exosome catalytic subunit dis3 n=1 Tax=Mucor velutinosus TaxID=708070 RepID=A0AAN7DBL9_9FUNG|nr:exosome catalytic subunit dis3 [Mucor velutinosus]
MVRATIFVSALFALAATVSAIPRPDGTLVDIDSGDHIGTGDLNFDNALQNVVNANNLRVQDVGYDINALSDDYDGAHSGNRGSDCGHHHHHHRGGLLHGLLKRGEAPAGTVRIARKNKGKKMMNNKSKKAAAAAAAAVKMA